MQRDRAKVSSNVGGPWYNNIKLFIPLFKLEDKLEVNVEGGLITSTPDFNLDIMSKKKDSDERTITLTTTMPNNRIIHKGHLQDIEGVITLVVDMFRAEENQDLRRAIDSGILSVELISSLAGFDLRHNGKEYILNLNPLKDISMYVSEDTQFKVRGKNFFRAAKLKDKDKWLPRARIPYVPLLTKRSIGKNKATLFGYHGKTLKVKHRDLSFAVADDVTLIGRELFIGIRSEKLPKVGSKELIRFKSYLDSLIYSDLKVITMSNDIGENTVTYELLGIMTKD